MFAIEVMGMMGFYIAGDVLAHCMTRVPISIIHELNRKPFTSSDRPSTREETGPDLLPSCLNSDPHGPEGILAW